MNNDIESLPLPIIFILITYAIIVIQIDTPTLILIVLAGISVIIGLITAIIYLLTHRASRRDREQPVINEIIDDFVRPAALQLIQDRYNSNRFVFPDSLNLSFGISISGNAFNRFSRRKRLLTWRISRYNRFCRKIDRRIGSLTALSTISHIIESIVDAEGVHLVLTEQYENYSREQLNEILEQNNLMQTIREIRELQRELPIKSNRLLDRLRNLIERWREIYNIV